jgi:hypothetical protein
VCAVFARVQDIKQTRATKHKERAKKGFGVGFFLNYWLSRYTLAIFVISEKATEGLVIGNRRNTMTVIRCPSVYVCGDAVFGDASERQQGVIL